MAVILYQDEIKSALIARLNQGLRAEVRISPADIDVTIIRSFPQCAIELQNVLMLEAIRRKDRDTLLFARTISLRFDLYDLWHRRYVIRGLDISRGVIRPIDYKDGTSNYVFWKEDKAAGRDSFQFRFDEVRLSDIKFQYRDLSSSVLCKMDIRKVRLSGDFSESRHEIDAGAEVFISELLKGDGRLLKNKSATFDVKLAVAGEAYTIEKANVRLNDLGLALQGSFRYGERGLDALALRGNAPDLQISSLLSLLPARYRDEMGGFESSGKFFMEGELNFQGKRWTARSAFGATSAVITNSGGGNEARDVNFSGTFVYDRQSYVEVHDLSAQVAGGTISGKARVENFDHPRLEVEAKVDASLEQLQGFLQVDTISEISGKINLDLRLAGDLAKLKSRQLDPEVAFSLDCNADQLVVRFKHDAKTYAVSHCEVLASNSEIEVRDLLLKRGNSDVLLNGHMPGLLAYLLGQPVPLEINGTLVSGHFDFADFMSTQAGKAGNGNSPLIPKGLVLRVNTTLKDVRFGKFRATDVTGLSEISGQKLMVSDMELRTMEGRALISAFADNSKGRLDVAIESKFSHINVQELFAQMNDFGQSTLSHKQLRGYATAALDFSGVWSNSLESDARSIRASCDLTIDRGELMGFSPLQKLGRFVDVKDLEHIRFSTLTGKVEIADQKITIPRTSIKNSAINLDFWGSHTFDHVVDYHFQLLLSDLIAARRRKAPADDEFGPVARDPENRRSAYIVMTGPLDNPRIAYDRKGLQQKIKNDIRAEKETMKLILKEEFGMKEKERNNTPDKPAEFRIEQPETKPARKTELVLKKKEEEDF